jgi:hypothetical protein
MKNIDRDIKVVKAYLYMFEALTPPEMLSESRPIIVAIRNICIYAEEHYRKEFIKDSMDTLTKIITGEKDEDIKKH